MSDEIERLGAELAKANRDSWHAEEGDPSGEYWDVTSTNDVNSLVDLVGELMREENARAIALAHNLMPALIELAKAAEAFEREAGPFEDPITDALFDVRAAIRQELGEQ